MIMLSFMCFFFFDMQRTLNYQYRSTRLNFWYEMNSEAEILTDIHGFKLCHVLELHKKLNMLCYLNTIDREQVN